MPQVRLQKILSAAGVASRRRAEELLTGGHVQVNGETVVVLGTRADPEVDDIRVDGSRVKLPTSHTYLLLNKPRGYVSALSDPQGRPTIRDLLPPSVPRVFHVGRLDFQTEGLLLLTDDGDFANGITHPRYGCPKVYLAKVRGNPDNASLERLRTGISLDGVRTAPAQVERVRSTRRDGNTWLSLTLVEGRSREVRRMLHAVGHGVTKLKRVRIGPLDDRALKPGAVRPLTAAEIEALRSASNPRPRAAARPKPAPRRPARGR